MTTPVQNFSLLISGREVPLIMGTLNSTISAEGKLSLIIVDEHDWFLRVTLTNDTLTSTLVNFQRQFTIVEASVLLANVRVEHRVEKSRLTIAKTYEKSTLHLRVRDFSNARPSDFATPWRYAAEYDDFKTQAETRRYTIVSLGEGRVTDEPGGNVRFELDGGTHLTCYMSRTMTKEDILAKQMSTVMVSHTRLSRRTGGFHTTHGSCLLPFDMIPEAWRTIFDAESRGHPSAQRVVDLSELLAGGGWVSSPNQGTPPPARTAMSTSVPSAMLSTPTPRKEESRKKHNMPSLLELEEDGEHLQKDFHQYADPNQHADPKVASTVEATTTTPFVADMGTCRVRSPEPNPDVVKHKAVLSDGKIQVTDESVDYLRVMSRIWFRDGPRGRKWIPALKVVSGGEIKLVLQLHDGTTKHVERRRVAYSNQDE